MQAFTLMRFFFKNHGKLIYYKFFNTYLNTNFINALYVIITRRMPPMPLEECLQ